MDTNTIAIILKNGDKAIIDWLDADPIIKFTWNSHTDGYAVAWDKDNKKKIYMHRYIMGVPPGEDYVVDHIDGDRLNNRRSNLRWVTKSQSNKNRAVMSHSKTGYKGVYWDKSRSCYCLTVKGFETPEEAARAYDLVAPLAHGEYARLNFGDNNGR